LFLHNLFLDHPRHLWLWLCIEKDPEMSGHSTDDQPAEKLDKSKAKAGRVFEVIGVPIFKAMVVFSGVDKLNEGIEDVIRNPTGDEASGAPDFLASNQESSLVQDRYRILKEWSPSRPGYREGQSCAGRQRTRDCKVD
jgi:hypothetical protein